MRTVGKVDRVAARNCMSDHSQGKCVHPAEGFGPRRRPGTFAIPQYSTNSPLSPSSRGSASGRTGLSSANYDARLSSCPSAVTGHLGLFVALATAVTIFVIASSYSQIVELFPSGGGGYPGCRASSYSPTLGMISGSALLIDYVLTITLSVASGADAIFSFLPLSMQPLKIALAVAGVLVLTLLNLRGVKESVAPLVPIFLLFLLTHTFAIVYALVTHVPVGQVARDTAVDVHAATAQLGTFGVIVLVLRAEYSMGSGHTRESRR